jgi:hypothetical protein
MPSHPSDRAMPPWPLPQPSADRMRRRHGPPLLPLPIAAGHRCRGASGRLPLSQGAPTSAAGAGGARTPPAPHPDS